MATKQNYWFGPYPSTSKGWQGAEHGIILDLSLYGERLFRLYRRYAKQWNDIELDVTRSLAEHTHRICGAHVVGSSGGFILTHNTDRENGWILDVDFVRSFRQYYPGRSTGLNALRTIGDIKRVALHWRGNGRESFEQWMNQEMKENGAKDEWNEYKS